MILWMEDIPHQFGINGLSPEEKKQWQLQCFIKLPNLIGGFNTPGKY